jgi:hypothetical protein
MPRRRAKSKPDLFEPYGQPGKFEGEPLLTEVLWIVVLEGGADEELGESESFGSYALLTGLDGSELGGDIGDTKAAILSENSQGFVSGEYYDSAEEAREAWEEIESEYDEFMGDEEEEE